LLAYQPSSARDRTPLRRRASGLGLALAVNLLLLFVLLGIGRFAPVAQKASQATVVDLIPESHSAAPPAAKPDAVRQPTHPAEARPLPKPPPIVLPSKPAIAPPATAPAWIEMSKDELAAADISNLPKSSAGSGSSGDSEEVGRGPHGEVLYAAEWARHPTDAELGGYLPRNAPDGYGLIACKTVPGDRVDDCVELGQQPLGSHLASAVRQAAWQFRVRPPRRNGRPLIGSWVQIRIDYERIERSERL
jgi:periplasmic protein TonB